MDLLKSQVKSLKCFLLYPTSFPYFLVLETLIHGNLCLAMVNLPDMLGAWCDFLGKSRANQLLAGPV